MKREIILHMLQWNLNDIIKELPTIKDCGYTSIQISPVQRCKDGDEWWCLYQPLGFTIGNRYGSKEDLINLYSKLIATIDFPEDVAEIDKNFLVLFLYHFTNFMDRDKNGLPCSFKSKLVIPFWIK